MYSIKLIAGDIEVRNSRFCMLASAYDYASDHKIRRVSDKKFEGSIGKIMLIKYPLQFEFARYSNNVNLCVSALEFVFGNVPKTIYYA